MEDAKPQAKPKYERKYSVFGPSLEYAGLFSALVGVASDSFTQVALGGLIYVVSREMQNSDDRNCHEETGWLIDERLGQLEEKIDKLSSPNGE